MKTGNLRLRVDWDQEGLIEELNRLVHEQCSGAKIAAALTRKFNQHITRNAVIGKKLRLGLMDGLPHSARPHKPAKPRKRIRRNRVRFTGADFVAGVIEFESVTKLNGDHIPLEQRKQLLDLEVGDCRFPYGDVGDDDFFFCGGDTLKIPDCPYCPFHYRLTHSPPRKISRAEFERNRILGLRATERLRVKREAAA